MDTITDCPLCEQKLDTEAEVTERERNFLVKCNTCGSFEITQEPLMFTDVNIQLREAAPRLIEWVKRENAEGKQWPVINSSML